MTRPTLTRRRPENTTTDANRYFADPELVPRYDGPMLTL